MRFLSSLLLSQTWDKARENTSRQLLRHRNRQTRNKACSEPTTNCCIHLLGPCMLHGKPREVLPPRAFPAQEGPHGRLNLHHRGGVGCATHEGTHNVTGMVVRRAHSKDKYTRVYRIICDARSTSICRRPPMRVANFAKDILYVC